MKQMCNKQSGSALLITMALMVALTLLSIVAVERSTPDIDLSFNQLHGDKAFYVAEAGLRRGVVSLNEDELWRTGYVSQALGDGLYDVDVIDSSTVASLDDTIILRARGKVAVAFSTL